MHNDPHSVPDETCPPDVSLRKAQRLLLAFALVALALLPLVVVPFFLLLPYFGVYLLILWVPLSGLFLWSSFACALALASRPTDRVWLARDGCTSFLALVATTFFSSALAAVGLIAVVRLAALFFVGQILVLWLLRGLRFSLAFQAFAQVGIVGVCLVLIPLAVMGRTPSAHANTEWFNAYFARQLHPPDANARRARRQKDLMQAARDDRLFDIEDLLAHGADPNEHDLSGATALSVAEPAAAELLLSRKADPNHRDSHGRTAFLAALRDGNPETLKLLVAHGADVRARDFDGRTALLTLLEEAPVGRGAFLAGGRSYRLAEWLIRQGVLLDARASDAHFSGLKASEVAARRALPQVQALLEEHACPAFFSLPESEQVRSQGVDQRAALLFREPALENRHSLYRALRKNIGTVEGGDGPPGTFLTGLRGSVSLVPGEDGSPLLVLYGGQPPSDLPLGFRRVDILDLIDLAADHGAGLLVKSGFGPGDPAVVVPPADISLIRRCGGG